jgi:putative ABC transport system permease protein
MVLVHFIWFGAAILIVAATTAALARWAGVGLGWQPIIVVARAGVQLTIIATLLHGVLSMPWTVALFVLLMLSTATWTAGKRLAQIPHGRRYALIGVLAGSALSLALMFALRLVSFEPRYIVAIAGIVIGNTMSASTLAGRNFRRSAQQRRDEIEGWLSLGATPPQAHLEIGRQAVHESLLPNLDQTRNTGLVTLPGAFVGALFGGADPSSAAQFQLVVLATVAMAMIITAIIVTRLAGRSPVLLIDEGTLPRANTAPAASAHS